MVSKNWEHPRDGEGRYVPLYGGDCDKAQKDWDTGLALWCRGLRDDFEGGQESHDERRDVYGWVQYDGQRPATEDYMPAWPKEARTHCMMYETTTEGTPISPAFVTPEELARWLTDNGASAFGGQTASYEGWLRVARGGYAPSAVMDARGFRSGVDGV
jgi:hypothetical protein